EFFLGGIKKSIVQEGRFAEMEDLQPMKSGSKRAFLREHSLPSPPKPPSGWRRPSRRFLATWTASVPLCHHERTGCSCWLSPVCFDGALLSQAALKPSVGRLSWQVVL